MGRSVFVWMAVFLGSSCTSLNADFDRAEAGGRSGTQGGESSEGTTEGSSEPSASGISTTGSEPLPPGVPGRCGNGQVDDGEACDDAINDGSYGGCNPGCTSVAPRCGDGVLDERREVCDDGINDGSYDGCDPGCASRPARCGDGVPAPDHGEECDDGNTDEGDGCISTCIVPHSCLDIRESIDTVQSGIYKILLFGRAEFVFEVYCDMDTDGGGYTFLKIDADQAAFAPDAEAQCEAWGMQLWIPRTPAHRDSGWAVANDNDIAPDGSPDYMAIMGVYPAFPEATCANEPLNSDNDACDWVAGDGERFWVEDHDEINEPNGNGELGGSMFYQWETDGTLAWYDDVSGQGGSSPRFMCDIGDKY